MGKRCLTDTDTDTGAGKEPNVTTCTSGAKTQQWYVP